MTCEFLPAIAGVFSVICFLYGMRVGASRAYRDASERLEALRVEVEELNTAARGTGKIERSLL